MTATLQLAFARKPIDVSEARDSMHGTDRLPARVVETVVLPVGEFQAFASRLLVGRTWLAGKGGQDANGVALCVKVVCDQPRYATFYVNPEGSDYARYVAVVD